MADQKKNGAKSSAKRSNRKSKKKGTSPVLVIVLAIILIGAGVAAGFLLGSGSHKDVPVANTAETSATPDAETAEAESDDVFTRELNGENDAALADLAGDGADDTAAILGGDVGDLGGFQNTDDDTTVVAEYTGGKLYRGEVAEAYNDSLNVLIFAGYSEEEISEELLQAVMEDLILNRVLESKAKEMGCYELTDEEKAQAEQEATANYAEQVSFYIEFVREDGMTDQEAEAAAEQFLKDYEGITYEGLYQETVQSVWLTKLYNIVTENITITEDSVRSAYDDTLSLQEASFTESAENYEMEQLNGTVILYNPEGYRAIKIINFYVEDDALMELIDLEDELSTLDPASDADRIAEINTRIDAAYTGCTERAQAALDELNGGATFDATYAKYSEDQEYTPDSVKSTGYYISASSVLYDEATISAAMALSKPGDVSSIIRTESGVSILMYVGDVTPGAVAYETVHDALEAQTLDEAKATEFDAKCTEWVAAVNPVYYPERMY